MRADRYTAKELADMLVKDYFPMPRGASLYLSAHEWQMVVDALRSSGPSSELLNAAEAMAATGASATHIVELIRASCGATSEKT